MAGRPPAVTDYEILRAVIQTLDESGDPAVTTKEIAERVPIKREGLGQRLNAFADWGVLERKQVGRSYIWWVQETARAILRAAGRDRTAEDITDRSIKTQLQELFEVGQERFDLELGALARIDPGTDYFEIEHASGRYQGFEPGTELPLSETYCTTAAEAGGPAGVTDPTELGIEERTVHNEIGLKTYLGTLIELDEGQDRTFFFVSSESRSDSFSKAEYAFHDLLGQGAKHVLEQISNESVRV